MIDTSIFRAYDIRGVVDKTLREEDATLIGQAFATWLVHHGYGRRLVVGYDGRTHSPRLVAALIQGLTQSGCDVTNVGLGPTPYLYYNVYAQQADAGIMVTGSHNPPECNGLKMMLKGKPFYGEAIQELAAIVNTGSMATGQGQLHTLDSQEAYVTRLLEGAEFGAHPLKVVWDAGNGAAGDVMQRLVAKLPMTSTCLFADIDGAFPNHHPDPTVPENLEALKAEVLAQKADVGIAFDGDGDRIGLIDDEGEMIWGDQLIYIYASAVLRERPNATIIADVKASQTLFDGIKKLGGQPLMWKTGHSHIKAKMAETGAPLAGEMSGHIFFADKYYGFDDALYAAVRLLEIISQSGKTVSSYRKALPPVFNTPELRFACADDKKFGVVEALQSVLTEQGIDFNAVDGIRCQTEQGWWLLRASNTQEVLVARCEASSEQGLLLLKKQLSDALSGLNIDNSALQA